MCVVFRERRRSSYRLFPGIPQTKNKMQIQCNVGNCDLQNSAESRVTYSLNLINSESRASSPTAHLFVNDSHGVLSG